MARALRSSGASGAASPPSTPNGTATRGRLKRKRTGDDEHSPKPAPRRDDTDSGSPLTDLPSPGVKEEADGDPAFLDGCDQPPPAPDAHKLLAVLEMFDTQSLLTRPVHGSTLRAMLKHPRPVRALKAAVSALLPTQPHPRARLSLEHTAQRSFCELALGLLEEIAQKQLVSKDRSSIFQTPIDKPDVPDDRPTRYALHQTIYGTDYYTSVSADSLTPEAAASLATGQASLTAIIPAAPIPASAMPTLGAYARKPVVYHSPWLGPRPTVPGMLELSYGPRCSFAPTYDSSGSTVTRSEIDRLAARRTKACAFGPPPPLPPPLRDADADMADGAKPPEPPLHPDLVPALDPPESTSPSTCPPTPKASTLDPTLDPDLCGALDTAFQQLALEDSVRGLLQSNARAMTRLVDLQNERFQRWNSRKPDLAVLDVGQGDELELARCIEKTLGLLTALRPRTILSSLPTSLVPPASVLRALHRTLPTEPSPGYRGTLDPRREMSLRDDTTIKMANVPPAPAPAPAPAATPRAAAPVAGRPGYPTPAAASTYYSQQAYAPQVGQYPQAQGVYPQGQYPAYQPQQTQYPVTQPVQYPATPAAGAQAQYPYPYTYPNAAAGYPAPAQPTAGAYPTPVPGQTTYPAPAAGQAPVYPAPGQAATYPAPGTYPTPGQATTYPTPATPAAGTPRVITNVIKPAAQTVWSPGQGYTATPTSAATPAAAYVPPVGGYNPAAPVQYPATPGYTASPTTGYQPVGAYAPTPVKPSVRGPIPLHVRSTPGTPASPAAYLPLAGAVPGAGGYAWNGARGATPTTPRPAQ